MNLYDQLLLKWAKVGHPQWLAGSAFRKFCRRNRGLKATTETRVGFKFQVQVGDTVDNLIYVYGDFEPATSRVFEAVAPQCSHFVDVGCNVGYFSCLVHQCAPDVSISCVDVNPAMVERSLANLTLNGCVAQGFNFGVADREDELTFYVPENRHSLSSFAYQPEKGGNNLELEIPVRPLGKIVDFSSMEDIFLKVDTEGFEYQVFNGLTKEETDKLQAVVFECSSYNFQRSSMSMDKLFQLPLFSGFEVYEIMEDQNVLHKMDVETGPYPDNSNVLLLRPELKRKMIDKLGLTE